jgi:hypothetical protein
MFHVSQLKKYLKASMDVVLPNVAPLEADLTYPEHPIKILDQKDHATRRKTIKFYKVQWSHHTKEEVMWESEDFLHSRHPVCSLSLLEPFSFQISGQDFFLGGKGCDTPSVTISATVYLQCPQHVSTVI